MRDTAKSGGVSEGCKSSLKFEDGVDTLNEREVLVNGAFC